MVLNRYVIVEKGFSENVLPRKWYKILEEKRDEYKLCNGAGGSHYVRKDHCSETLISRKEEINWERDAESEGYDYIRPPHYEIWKDTQAFDIIENTLTPEEYIGFLKGNILRYKLRIGDKPNEPVERDQKKVITYKQLLNNKLCRN